MFCKMTDLPNPQKDPSLIKHGNAKSEKKRDDFPGKDGMCFWFKFIFICSPSVLFLCLCHCWSRVWHHICRWQSHTGLVRGVFVSGWWFQFQTLENYECWWGSSYVLISSYQVEWHINTTWNHQAVFHNDWSHHELSTITNPLLVVPKKVVICQRYFR